VPIRRRRKRRGASTGQAPVKAAYRGHVWAIDFQADHLEDGTGLKIASIIDEHTRQVLDDTVDVSITGEDIVNILERLSITHGLPAILRMDNGPELTCRALAQWAAGVVDLAFIPPGEPWKNGYVESFHSRQRDELLNITTFPSLLHARVELTDWHREYNQVRRHSSLGYKTPTEYAEHCTCTKPD
jgi:transposase InsO family protein